MRPYYEEPGITIYHGDCLEVLPTLTSASIALTVTSPPYDNLRAYGQPWSVDYPAVIAELWRLTMHGGVVVWVIDDQKVNGSETGNSLRQALSFMDIGFWLHDKMIYEKMNGSYGAPNEYLQCFELMYVFSKSQPRAVHLLRDRKNVPYQWNHIVSGKSNQYGRLTHTNKYFERAEYGRRKNLWRYAVGNPQSFGYHPAPFPYNLARDHIYSWSDSADVILDPLMGRGTVLHASKELGRHAIGIEIEERYCEIAVKSLRQEVLPLVAGSKDGR